ATVFSSSGRAERWSSKKSVGRKGIYFGWSCMSCRHPVAAIRSSAVPEPAKSRLQPRLAAQPFVQRLDSLRHRSMRNFSHLAGFERLQKLASLTAVEKRIRRLDAKEETVARCQRE